MADDSSVTMRDEEEIWNRLEELHGTYIAKEMGGWTPLAEAKALLWALGYDNPYVSDHIDKRGFRSEYVDVSRYMEVDPIDER